MPTNNRKTTPAAACGLFLIGAMLTMLVVAIFAYPILMLEPPEPVTVEKSKGAHTGVEYDVLKRDGAVVELRGVKR